MTRKKKALIISISEYDQFHKLEFCVNDGLGIFNVLSNHDYEIHKGKDLIGEVTGNDMRDNLVDFFTDPSISQDDLLLFFFSGHGYYDDKTGETFLTSSDFDCSKPHYRGIPFDHLTNFVKKCASDKVIVILDCCYSGALELGKGGETKVAEIAQNVISRQLKELDDSIGKCILASSLDEQLSFKKKDADISLFSYYVINGLEGGKGESVDVRGNVTVESLGRYLTKYMMSLNKFKQRPIKKIEMSGDIVIVEYPEMAQSTAESILIQLLKENRSQDFNKLRNFADRLDFSNIELEDIVIDGFGLSFINFENSKFTNVEFRNCDLSSCNFAHSLFDGVKSFNCNFTNCQFYGSIINSSGFSNVRLDYSQITTCQLNNIGFENCAFYYTIFGINSEIYPTLDYSPTFLNTVALSECHFYETDFKGTNFNGVGFGGGLFYNVDFKYSKLESVAIKSNFSGLINFNHSYIQGVVIDINSGVNEAILSFTASYHDNFELNTNNDRYGQLVVIGLSNFNLINDHPMLFEFIRETNVNLLNKFGVTINQKIQIRQIIYFITKKLYDHSNKVTNQPKLEIYDFQALITAILSIRDENNDIYFTETKKAFEFLDKFMRGFGFCLDEIIKQIITNDNYPSSVAKLINPE